MSKIYGSYTYLFLTDKKTRDLLDKYDPGLSKIPLSVLIDTALNNAAGTFLSLTDTPAAYVASNEVRVNAAGTALEFVAHTGNLWVVDLDGAAGGIGTYGSPFNTVAAANAVALPGDVVEVLPTATVLPVLPIVLGLNYKLGHGLTVNLVTLTGSGYSKINAPFLNLLNAADVVLCTFSDNNQNLDFVGSTIVVAHSGVLNPIAFDLAAGVANPTVTLTNSCVYDLTDGAMMFRIQSPTAQVIISGSRNYAPLGFPPAEVMTVGGIAINLIAGNLTINNGARVISNSAANPVILLTSGILNLDGKITNLGVGSCIDIIGGVGASLNMQKNAWLTTNGVIGLNKTDALSSISFVPCSKQMLAITTALMGIACTVGEAEYDYVVLPALGDPDTLGPAGAPLPGTTGSCMYDITSNARWVNTGQVPAPGIRCWEVF